jgi:LysM repeat protein
MATVMNSDKESREFESLPEYVRESKPRTRDTLEFTSAKYQPETSKYQSEDVYQPEAESIPTYVSEPEIHRATKNDMLETLWPGVHHDFGQGAKRPPSFYLTLGFMAGAVISLVAVWFIGSVSPMVANIAKPNSTAVVTQKPENLVPQAAQPTPSSPDSLMPVAPTYEVASGDTLAGIAFKNYKHCSPRLLDEICKANNMANANVLQLGQKLTLPEYHPRLPAQIATTTAAPAVR